MLFGRCLYTLYLCLGYTVARTPVNTTYCPTCWLCDIIQTANSGTESCGQPLCIWYYSYSLLVILCNFHCFLSFPQPISTILDIPVVNVGDYSPLLTTTTPLPVGYSAVPGFSPVRPFTAGSPGSVVNGGQDGSKHGGRPFPVIY